MTSSHLQAPSVRPLFTRSRSQTIPSNRAASAEEPTKPTRPPSSGRSSSFMSPVDPKPREAQTLPVGSSNRISHGQRNGQPKESGHLHRHRHTQSDVHGTKKEEKAEALPHLTARLAVERARHEPGTLRGTDFLLGPRAQEVRRMASTRSYRHPGVGDATNVDGRQDHRLRASSDPRRDPRSIKSPIEVALERADAKKATRSANSTQKDVERIRAAAKEAEDELRSRLVDIGQTATDITRRLDYTYYSLLERVGNLVSTIHSFRSLSTQSQALIDNFSTEAEKLDIDIKRKMGDFRKGFDAREKNVSDLERRGTKANNKAVQLGQRLENARTTVENWERREQEVRKRRGRMFKGTWWTLISILGIAVMLVLWKEWKFGSDPVRAGLGLQPEWHSNKTLKIDVDEVSGEEIPEEVKSILHSIKARRKTCGWTKAPSALKPAATAEEDDKRLRAFDEL